MLTMPEKGRDKSGQSGQPYKYWVSKRPEFCPDLTAVGTNFQRVCIARRVVANGEAR